MLEPAERLQVSCSNANHLCSFTLVNIELYDLIAEIKQKTRF